MFKKLVTYFSRLIFLNYKYLQKNGTITVFMFHKLNDEKSIFYQGMPISTFEKQCKYIQQNYHVINLSDIALDNLSLDKKYAIITFDDGHKEILTKAYPILKRLNLPFNINIDTEILDTGHPQDFVKVYDILNQIKLPKKFALPSFGIFELENKNSIQIEQLFTKTLSELSRSKRKQFIDELVKFFGFDISKFSEMLTKEDVVFLSNVGVEIGSHSHSHAILTSLTDEELRFELLHSKEVLENITTKTVSILAYPNGVFNENVEKIALENGYSLFLETEDQINELDKVKGKVPIKLKRVNQYHQTLNESLFHTYDIKNKMQFWKHL